MLKKFIHTHFRCPFEIAGRQEKLIIDVELDVDCKKGFWKAREAFQKIHSDTKQFAIIFKLPEYPLKECTNFETLRTELVPYQATILAAELDFRLYPFLPHQFTTYAKDDAVHAQRVFAEHPEKVHLADIIVKTMIAQKFEYPRKQQDVVDWISYHIRKGIRTNGDDATLVIGLAKKPELSISTGGISFQAEEGYIIDSRLNQNSFYIVRSSLYPKTFGRYAHGTEIVVTRQADFSKLPKEKRKVIRSFSNGILKKFGVRIKNLEDDKQGGGLWVPKFKD